MCDVLAEGKEGEPGGAPPAKLSLEHVVALKPLLPLNNAFQLLIQPLPARGLGLRLKRTLQIPLCSRIGSMIVKSTSRCARPIRTASCRCKLACDGSPCIIKRWG